MFPGIPQRFFPKLLQDFLLGLIPEFFPGFLSGFLQGYLSIFLQWFFFGFFSDFSSDCFTASSKILSRILPGIYLLEDFFRDSFRDFSGIFFFRDFSWCFQRESNRNSQGLLSRFFLQNPLRDSSRNCFMDSPQVSFKDFSWDASGGTFRDSSRFSQKDFSLLDLFEIPIEIPSWFPPKLFLGFFF